MRFLKSLSVFAGTIIGVGIFGLPYVALKAGFLMVIFYFLVMTGVAVVIHLFLGKVALGTTKLHRLPGYAEEYLGPRWKKASLVVLGLGLTGALLAYLIVGGDFLTFLLKPYWGGSNLIYSLIFFALGAYLILRDIKSVSQIELALLFVFFAIIILFFVKAYPFINLDYLIKGVDWHYWALPYGVVLFSLWGTSIVPEVKEMLVGDAKTFKRVIVSGILLAAATYLFFIFTVLGASGSLTSEEAISGLARALDDRVIKLGFIFGVITCFTSFLTLGLTLKKTLWYDFNLSPYFAWLVACFGPLFLFLAGVRQFIEVVSLTGAVAVGSEALIIIFLYRAFLKKKFGQKLNPFFYLLTVFFILGTVFEIFYLVASNV